MEGQEEEQLKEEGEREGEIILGGEQEEQLAGEGGREGHEVISGEKRKRTLKERKKEKKGGGLGQGRLFVGQVEKGGRKGGLYLM